MPRQLFLNNAIALHIAQYVYCSSVHNNMFSSMGRWGFQKFQWPNPAIHDKQIFGWALKQEVFALYMILRTQVSAQLCHHVHITVCMGHNHNSTYTAYKMHKKLSSSSVSYILCTPANQKIPTENVIFLSFFGQTYLQLLLSFSRPPYHQSSSNIIQTDWRSTLETTVLVTV